MQKAKLDPRATAVSTAAVLWVFSPIIALFVGVPLFIAIVAFAGAFIAAWPVTVPLTIFAVVKLVKKLRGRS